MNQVKEFLQWIFDAMKFWVIIQPWESALRVRLGKHITKLSGGIYFRIPYLDSIYVQENRLRVFTMSMQTLTSKDLKTITIEGSVGYIISDIEKLYETLYRPESTIANIVKSEMAEYIFNNETNDIVPEKLEKVVLEKLNMENYGLIFEYFKVSNFALVKTFRLIQDQSWTSEGVYMNDKK
ncbi:SPFH domain-containing protein [Chryseobacterium sp. 52]|uniref:SPFH domain-containing protein n=1 Tax=Chryseobacterium sp. 52 TaxID=2035213 RepID=UPI000C194528|nr:SPFH domain-containing protein [Chryseobacterium sp. 52]